MSADSSRNDAATRLAAIERLLDRTCRVMAAAGGLLLLGMVIVTVVSVASRFLGGRPIPGDFEIVEVGAAVAVFLFLPYCQLRRGNVVVDIFTAGLSASANRLLEALGSLLYAAIAALLAWRMVYGGIDMYQYGEQTMILGMDRWWGFVPIVISAAVLAAVCLFTVVRSLVEARS